MRICISVGHGRSAGGGYDSGAVGGGFHEFRIARKIGFYIAEALKNYGCDTVLIRSIINTPTRAAKSSPRR